ncbi:MULTISPECIES: thiol:disulfide interchange protein DsbA/DsbL [Legionella]|uniref:Thiol:disulfide interchange protein n=1 Tax=Legionella drozanskii LLAP-1 TaxID=1212489 RepID=A0A0W0SYR9_9GAMM|nr:MULTISPECIES: thiol:disulfide interchange protein DsbA/DsbL [Legionella]KTC88085.1 thiol:disulfide interchange protein DsbA [Legionella drozanskii LLAP-1]PJE08272.1 MAG: disulfide bond formation protein DsbA [Legionella sp.]
MLKRFVAIVLLLLPLLASAEEFVAGKDYELINGADAKSNTPKVAVTEFFSYGCPWCYRIDPALMTWVKQQGNAIQFSRVPVVFNKDWTFYAKAYYTANLLGLESKLNPLLFKAIQDKGHSMNSNQAMIDFFTAQGIDPTTAKSAFENSTTIDMQLNQGTTLMARYHVNGVPAIVVNNQFKIDLQMAREEARLFKILDFLIAKTKSKESKSAA